VHDCVYLGSDQWGDWFGQRAGWRSSRPGREFIARAPNVMLLPPSGDYALTVNAQPAKVRIYIDIAWDVRWSDAEPGSAYSPGPEGVDMDLDVVRAVDERGLFIDDRDEWDEHRLHYGYPLDLVATLETLTLDLESRVGAREAPFDDATADAWLGRLAELPDVITVVPIAADRTETPT
jgi:protein associated with RNAse G/E